MFLFSKKPSTQVYPLMVLLLMRHSRFFNYHPFEMIHGLSVGASGTGKTYFNKLLIGKVILYQPKSQVTILDFKADDYHFCRGSPRLYEFEAVKEGLEKFYEEFLSRQQGKNLDRSYRLLVIEELGSMLGYFDKKTADSIKTQIANLIYMGRSFHTHVLLSLQRPDSTNFDSGAVRDSTNCTIALGNLSKDGKSMIFSGFQDELTEKNKQGEGYMLVDGSKLYSVKVPKVTNMKKLEHYIRLGVTRGNKNA